MNPTFLETSEPIQGSEVFFSHAPSRLLLIVLFVLAAGCSGEASITEPAPFYAGTFEASCSPVDGYALQFDLYRLGDAFPAQVSIAIWEFDLPMAGSQIRLVDGGGYGAVYISGTEWIPATDGEIGMDSFAEGETADGWFWLELDGIDHIEGRFEADWSESGFGFCG
jgi:hypothetical protein